MKWNLLVFIPVLAFVFPVAATAAGQNGWYLGFDAGQAHYAGLWDGANVLPGESTHISNNALSYRISAGYGFNQYFGLELGWIDFGTAEVDSTFNSPPQGTVNQNLKAQGEIIEGVGTYPISNHWMLYGRLGAIRGHSKFNSSGTGSWAFVNGSEVTDSYWKATYGIGVSWNLSRHWGVRAGYDQYLTPNNYPYNRINQISIGVTYGF